MKTNLKLLFCTVLVYSFTIGCQKGYIEPSVFKIQSDSFKDEIVIPAGDKPVADMIASPQLSWENVPLNTAHFIIIMDDNNPTKPHAWWIASVSNTISGLVEVKLDKSTLPDLIPMVIPLTKPLIPFFFPDPNQGALTNIMHYFEGNIWNTSTSCTLELFALGSLFQDIDFSEFKSQCYSMKMTRAKFRAFCKDVSVDILDSAKITYAVKHLRTPPPLTQQKERMRKPRYIPQVCGLAITRRRNYNH